MGYLMSLSGSRERKGKEEDLDSSGAAKILTRIISRDGRKSISGIEGEEEEIHSAILITSRNVTRAAAAFAMFDDELRKKMAQRLSYE